MAVNTSRTVLIEAGSVFIPLESQRPVLRAGRKSNNIVTLPTVGARDQSLFRDSRCRQGAKAARQLADAIPTSREKVNARRVAIARLTSAPFLPGRDGATWCFRASTQQVGCGW